MANPTSAHFDRKLDEILRRAAAVFCERGYHQASIRDIARSTGASLAGLYYYFSSKAHLLYLIQRHAFETLLDAARQAIEPWDDPEARLRTLVRLHLDFFIEHPNEMKVLTHEERSLEEDWRREVHGLKKAYYQLCYDEVEALKRQRKLAEPDTRTAVLALFGMMNWIYTWYNARRDPDAEHLAREMSNLFLNGILGGARVTKQPRRKVALAARNGSKPNGRSRRATGANGSRRAHTPPAGVALRRRAN